MKESRLTIRGDGDEDPVTSDEVWMRPVRLDRLVSQSATLKE